MSLRFARVWTATGALTVLLVAGWANLAVNAATVDSGVAASTSAGPSDVVASGVHSPDGVASKPAVPVTEGVATATLPSGATSVASSAETASSIAVRPVAEPVFTWGGYFEAIGIMLLLLGGLWLLLWSLRKYGKFNFIPSGQGLPRDALRMEAQLPLGPKKGLVVVRFLNERLLLGVTEHHISVLSERLIRESHDDAPTTPHVESGEAVSFAELLQGRESRTASESDKKAR